MGGSQGIWRDATQTWGKLLNTHRKAAAWIQTQDHLCCVATVLTVTPISVREKQDTEVHGLLNYFSPQSDLINSLTEGKWLLAAFENTNQIISIILA